MGKKESGKGTLWGRVKGVVVEDCEEASGRKAVGKITFQEPRNHN